MTPKERVQGYISIHLMMEIEMEKAVMELPRYKKTCNCKSPNGYALLESVDFASFGQGHEVWHFCRKCGGDIKTDD